MKPPSTILASITAGGCRTSRLGDFVVVTLESAAIAVNESIEMKKRPTVADTLEKPA